MSMRIGPHPPDLSITVCATDPGTVVLSTARTNCSAQRPTFSWSEEYRCCIQDQPWIADQRAFPQPMFPFNVFGVGPIDIQVETTWLYNHFPVDLRLQVVASTTTSIQVSANCYSTKQCCPKATIKFIACTNSEIWWVLILAESANHSLMYNYY